MKPPHADWAEPDRPDPDTLEQDALSVASDLSGASPAKTRPRLGEVISRTIRDEEFAHPRLKGLSELLTEATDGDATHIALEDLVDRLSARGLAPVVLAISLLNAVAFFPGSTAILGLPLLFLGVSLMIGAKRLWLPGRLRNRMIERAKLEVMIRRIIPYIQKLERLAHPRYWPGTNGVTDRIYGIFVFCLGVLVTLPIPLGNMLPAFSIALVSLGIMARDGLWVIAGIFLATLAIGVVIGVAGAVGLAGSHIIGG